MSEHEEIEAAVRAYFEAPLDEVHRLAAGSLAELPRLTVDLEDPSELMGKHLMIDALEIVRVEGDEAEAHLHGTDEFVVEMSERGRDRHRAVLHGPVRLRRIKGV